MTLNQLIRNIFEGKRLISINGKKINKIIKKINIDYDVEEYTELNFDLIFDDNSLKSIKITDNFELEESGM